MDDFIDMPDFKDKYEAARWAIEWAKENPNIFLSYGGPMYPVPREAFQEMLRTHYNVAIKATTGCEIWNFQDVVADVVNMLLTKEQRYEASRCVHAWFNMEDYSNSKDANVTFTVKHPIVERRQVILDIVNDAARIAKSRNNE